MTSEEAQMTGEVLKTGNEWAKLFFGPAAKQAGLILGDWVESIRARFQENRQSVGQKVEVILAEQDVTIKQLDDKILMPLLEGLSHESDDFLQDMWANLFVNYVDSEKHLNVVIYPILLKQLSSNEARLLTHLYVHNESGINVTLERDDLSFKLNEINHLESAGLIKEDVKYTTGNDNEVNYGGNSTYFLTKMGHDLLDACTRTAAN